MTKIESLTALLDDAKRELGEQQYAAALTLIREAKLVDLYNVYLTALEHVVTDLPLPPSETATKNSPAANTQVVALLIDRAILDCERRTAQSSQPQDDPDDQTLAIEKIKNLYFQRTDQSIEAKEYGRALEEVQRVYIFDPQNIVAKEYVLKIGQLIDLQKKQQ